MRVQGGVYATLNQPCNKNRKGLKISTIVDEKGSPLTRNISESTVHDSKLGTKDI